MVEKEVIGYYKKKLLEVTTILLDRGVYEYTAGHASVRIPSTDVILIPGHIHPERRTIGSLTEEDISLMDLDGNLLEGKLSPPGEKYIHTEIYKLRKDVGSVIHLHPKMVNALGIAGKEILPISLHSVIFYPKVPIHPYPGEVNTPELGKNHTIIRKWICGCSTRAWSDRRGSRSRTGLCGCPFTLEDSAELQLMVMAAGTPRILPQKYIEGKLTQGAKEWEFFGNPWVYYYNKYIKKRT